MGFILDLCAKRAELHPASAAVFGAILVSGRKITLLLKKIATMIRPILSALFLSFALAAGAQKYGYINSGEILDAMPEVKTANADLEKFGKPMQDEIKAKSDKLQEDSKKFSTRVSTGNIAQADYDKEVARLDAAQKEVSNLETELGKAMEAKQKDLMKPVYDKLNNAVKQVALEKGASAIFFSDVFAYADDTVNFTAAVKAKLGLK